MMNALWVALGSAAGGVLRYGLGRLNGGAGGFPWGTLAANAAGALLMGFLAGWLGHAWGGENGESFRRFAMAGFCGGFTTFSTFSLETVRMMEGGAWGMAAGYVALSVALGLAGTWCGLALAR